MSLHARGAPPRLGVFTYDVLEEILDSLVAAFDVRPLREALSPPGDRPVAVIRHDLDVSPARALPIARLEAARGIATTFLPVGDSRLYTLDGSGEVWDELRALGHEIGVHVNAAPGSDLDETVSEAAGALEGVLGEPVGSCSFHYPPPEQLRGPDRLAGRVNAYSEGLMRWYVSDSRGVWAHGHPLDQWATRGPVMQVLLHPIWWGAEAGGPEERLQDLFETVTAGRSPSARAAFDAALGDVITDVRRAGTEP